MSDRSPVTAGLDEDVLRGKLEEVLSRSEFHTETVQDNSIWWLEWMLSAIKWILKPFLWLIEVTNDLPLPMQLLIIIPLFAVAIGLIAHICWTLYQAMSGGRIRVPAYSSPAVATRLSADEWERRADEAVEEGDLIGAVRCLWRGCLVRLEDRERRPFRRGTTNREHLKRYRETGLFDPLETLVVTIEQKWYGDEVCEVDDYQECRQAHAEAVTLLDRGDAC